MRPVTRFAPTPSGFLHQGNAFNFLLTWLFARAHQGTIHLRIDDIDEERVRPEYLDDIFASLDWLGLDWDHGPQSVGQHQQEYRQRLRVNLYEPLLKRLVDSGQTFVCVCSRKDIRQLSEDGSYPGTCRDRNLSPDTPDTALRIRTPWPARGYWLTFTGTSDSEPFDAPLRDAIIRKKDGWPAYQLISVVEDEHAGITHIIRGEDLRPSTAFQAWLARLLDLPGFPKVRIHHHSLITDDSGGKLSKSAGAVSLQSQYKTGKSSETVIREFAGWMGWQTFNGSTSHELLAFAKELPTLISSPG